MRHVTVVLAITLSLAAAPVCAQGVVPPPSAPEALPTIALPSDLDRVLRDYERAWRHLIRDNKIHQIYASMQMGQEKYGMITFNQSLASLYFRRDISLELAMNVSHNTEELQELINRGPTALTSQFKSTHAAPGTSAGTGKASQF